MSVEVIDRNTTSFSQATLPEYNMCNGYCNYADEPVANVRNILAERFKTKLCSNFTANGFCPYESRCMFAHGEADLRTYEDNVADKIFTEDAIRAWRRAMRLINRNTEGKSSQGSPAPPSTFPAPPSYYSVVQLPLHSNGYPLPPPPEYGWCNVEYQSTCGYTGRGSSDECDLTSERSESPVKSTISYASSASKSSSVRRYKHDPYKMKGLVCKLSGMM